MNIPRTFLCAACAALLALAATACQSTPSAAGLTREQISAKYQNKEISRERYLSLMADYERLHPYENTESKALAEQNDDAPIAPSVRPEKAPTRNAPIMPTGYDQESYNP